MGTPFQRAFEATRAFLRAASEACQRVVMLELGYSYEHYRALEIVDGVERRRYEEKKIDGNVVLAEGDPTLKGTDTAWEQWDAFEKAFERKWWRRP